VDTLAEQCNPIYKDVELLRAFYQRSMRDLFHYVDTSSSNGPAQVQTWRTIAARWAVVRKMKMVAPCTFVHWRVVGTGGWIMGAV